MSEHPPVFYIDALPGVPMTSSADLEAVAREAAGHLLHLAARIDEVSPQARGVVRYALEQYSANFRAMVEAMCQITQVQGDRGHLQS